VYKDKQEKYLKGQKASKVFPLGIW